jgi:hypothetical protein
MLNKVKSSIAVSPIMREKTQVKHLKIRSPFFSRSKSATMKVIDAHSLMIIVVAAMQVHEWVDTTLGTVLRPLTL